MALQAANIESNSIAAINFTAYEVIWFSVESICLHVRSDECDECDDFTICFILCN